jgi:DNA-directed RNA polymerase specialized sigma24 family protein
VEAVDPVDLERRLDANGGADSDVDELPMLDWISDRELILFIERLPLVQRQVLMLRYMHDLSYSQIAEILGRSPDNVRKQQQRAIIFLRRRLLAVGRAPHAGRQAKWQRRPTYLRVLRSRRYVLS